MWWRWRALATPELDPRVRGNDLVLWIKYMGSGDFRAAAHCVEPKARGGR